MRPYLWVSKEVPENAIPAAGDKSMFWGIERVHTYFLDGVEWLIFGIFNFDKGVEIGDTTRTAMVMGGGHWGLSGN